MAESSGSSAMQEALEEHRALLALGRELRAFLEDSRPDLQDPRAQRWASSLSRQLVELHDKISRHFLAEEEGLLLDLRQRFPRAARRLDDARAEHRRILSDLRHLVSDSMLYAESKELADPRLRQRTRGVLSGIRSHEETVNGLLQELMLTDIGAGD